MRRRADYFPFAPFTHSARMRHSGSFCDVQCFPDLKLLGRVHVGSHPDWLTFTPDSKSV
jgi:hypothetical protein